MHSNIFSMEKFLRFMNRATRTGIFDQSQRKEWFRITTDIIGLLTPEEQRDLRTLDIRNLEARYAASFAQKNMGVSSWAIFQRKKFLTFAVGEFIAFSVNPRLYVKEQKRKYLNPAVAAHSAGAAAPATVQPEIVEHAVMETASAVPETRVSTGLRARKETGIEYQTRLLNNPVGRRFLAEPAKEALASNF